MKFIVRCLLVACFASAAVFAQSTPEKPLFSDAENAKIERERTPDFATFKKLLQSADRIEVIDDSEDKKKLLFETSKEIDLVQLRQALEVELPDEWRASICTSPSVVFYKGGKRLMTVGNVLAREVKTSVWSGNVLLKDPEKWLLWFDRRGMPQVRAERDREEQAARKSDEDERRWYEAMPRGIREPFEKQASLIGLPSMGDVREFIPILQKEYPGKRDRILALLHWYGSGEGSWSGYPGYESVAEDILFSFSTSEILDAVTSRNLSTTEIEGASRFFAAWDFHQKRPNDLKLIPANLVQQFLEHSLKSDDEDKRERAKSAFGKQ